MVMLGIAGNGSVTDCNFEFVRLTVVVNFLGSLGVVEKTSIAAGSLSSSCFSCGKLFSFLYVRY